MSTCDKCIYRYSNTETQCEHPVPDDFKGVILTDSFYITHSMDIDSARRLIEDTRANDHIYHMISKGNIVGNPVNNTCKSFKGINEKFPLFKKTRLVIMRNKIFIRSLNKELSITNTYEPNYDYTKIYAKYITCVDFDDTLVKSGHIWIEADRILLTENGVEYNKDEFLSHMKDLTFDGIFQMIHDVYLPFKTVEEITNRVLEIVHDSYDTIEYIDEVIDYIKWIKTSGSKIVITTSNIQSIVIPVLERMGLECDHIITSDNIDRNFVTKADMLRYVQNELYPNSCGYILIDDNRHCLMSALELGFLTTHPDAIIRAV